jgi:Domain of unknown function (DUF4249)
MKVRSYIGMVVLGLGACIQPLNVHLKPSQLPLTVDGLITDQPGPYTVKLSRALTVDDQLDQTDWVSGATIVISDDQGTQETLHETSPGNYTTSTIQGIIGRTYMIHITTAEGAVYESIPDPLLPVGDITRVYFEFVQPDTPPLQNPVTSANGFNVYLDGTFDPLQNGLMRWRCTGTYEIQTFPEQRLKIQVPQPPVVKNPIMLPDPEPCSGYIVDPKNKNLTIRTGSCTCCYCWANQYDDSPVLSDKRFTSGNVIKGQALTFVPVTRRTFFDKYYLEIEQLSISQTAYDFWNNVKSQKQNSSNLFQTPPPQTTGNIHALTNGALPAVGIFAAAAIKKTSLTFTRDQVPYVISPIDTLQFSCLEATKNITNIKPAFW